jgi:predicted nucleotidyltransferase
MKASHFSRDIQEFLEFLSKYKVKYVIVGGEAVVYHGHARLTGDVDFFYETSSENVLNLFRALDEFWKGDIPGVGTPEELMEPGIILQFGVPPNRIDLVSRIEDVSFDEAWGNKVTTYMDIQDQKIPIHFIGIDELIRNKEALGRPRDLEDLKYLREARKAKQQ